MFDIDINSVNQTDKSEGSLAGIVGQTAIGEMNTDGGLNLVRFFSHKFI